MEGGRGAVVSSSSLSTSNHNINSSMSFFILGGRGFLYSLCYLLLYYTLGIPVLCNNEQRMEIKVITRPTVNIQEL